MKKIHDLFDRTAAALETTFEAQPVGAERPGRGVEVEVEREALRAFEFGCQQLGRTPRALKVGVQQDAILGNEGQSVVLDPARRFAAEKNRRHALEAPGLGQTRHDQQITRQKFQGLDDISARPGKRVDHGRPLREDRTIQPVVETPRPLTHGDRRRSRIGEKKTDLGTTVRRPRGGTRPHHRAPKLKIFATDRLIFPTFEAVAAVAVSEISRESRHEQGG